MDIEEVFNQIDDLAMATYLPASGVISNKEWKEKVCELLTQYRDAEIAKFKAEVVSQ